MGCYSAQPTRPGDAVRSAQAAAWQLVIFEVSEGDRHPVWLLPKIISCRLPWLAALHRALALVDITALFLRLDCDLAVTSFHQHQALMHRLILSLRRRTQRSADARVTPLFEEDRWNPAGSTTSLASGRWHALTISGNTRERAQ